MIQVVTCTNRAPRENYYTWTEFHKSLEKFGHKAGVLGWQQPWGGLMTKPKRLLEWLKGPGPKPEHLLVADSWDIVFADSPESMLEVFEDMKCSGLVLNAEKNCFPLGHLADRFPDPGTSYRYLNSGFIIGYTEAFTAMLEHMYSANVPEGFNCDDHRKADGGVEHPNDQGFITLAYLDQPVEMMLDTQCRMCQTLCGCKLDEFDFSGEGIVNRETGSAPKAFHFNGGSKTDGLREPILNKLGV